jgi:putative oxidoreductase
VVLTSLTKYRDFGLLLLRVGLGVAFILHGWPKITGGPQLWTGLGSNVDLPLPAVFGFMAALGEFGGGSLLVLGWFFRPACILLLLTMLGALTYHLRQGDGFNTFSHALESAVVFAGLIFVGPGAWSVDRK